ncbi:hypothetical protein E3U55_07925 [Filobacillus milosensis]|uniref:YcxB family protein n=1 Tax=Filobacillus milosensis TaxID=94137 RepID=A0A4Y8INE0_9BACI|nr:hypothetical protein [Filobacillus milosensis]TFB21749.1 hypothetical protein E3U55_07925 [Filobacillus milosensis]
MKGVHIILHQHPYYSVRREIDHFNFEQKKIEQEHWVTLYEDRLVTEEKEYAIEQVFDLSYKMLSARYGFFYLHTTKGVTTLHIKKSPEEFIQKFRTVEKK